MHPPLLSRLDLGAKKNYLVALGGVIAILATAAICLKAYKSHTAKPQPMAHTIEYNAVVEDHIDTSKIPRGEIDLAVTKQELGQRFAVYQFDHPKLRGKWGNLNVFVDRQTGKSVSRSLLPVNNAHPQISASSEAGCLTAVQFRQDFEICIR